MILKNYRWVITFASLSALLIILIVLLVTKLMPRQYEDVMTSKTIKVATEYNSIGYYVEGGEIRGFNYELLKVFADSVGLTLDIVIESDLEKAINGLDNGTYDIILGNLPITTDMKRKVQFLTPIIKSKLLLVQRQSNMANGGTPLRNTLDLKGQIINTTLHSPYLMRLSHIEDEIGVQFVINQVPDVDTELLLVMVARGEIDYAISDEHTALYVKQYYPDLDIQTVMGMDQFYSWALSTYNPELAITISKWLENYKKTPSFTKLYNKYFDAIEASNKVNVKAR